MKDVITSIYRILRRASLFLIKKYRRLIMRLLVLACLIWGPSIYFGVIATIQAELLSEGRAYCWFVKNPNPPRGFLVIDEMLFTLDRSTPFRFWSDVFAFEKFDNVRPHYGIAIPRKVGSLSANYFGWSYRKHKFWNMRNKYYLAVKGGFEECFNMTNNRK